MPLSDLIPQSIKDAVIGRVDPYQQYEKNIAIVGTRGASKTTVLGCLGLTCEIESINNKNFTYDIQERTVGIRQIISDLCQGKFPPATPPSCIYEADIEMMWQNAWTGNKGVLLPLVETAGEDMEHIMGPFRRDMYRQFKNYQQAENLNKIIAKSNAFILVVPVSRVPAPFPQVVDQEPKSLLRNPDVNIVRILDGIYNYRERTRSKPIEGIAVLLTKYDMVSEWLKAEGMDLFTQEGQYQFLNTYLRQTMGKLKKYGYEKVKFFPVYVKVAKEQQPDGKLRFIKRADDDGFLIETDSRYNLPLYTKESYHEVIKWVKDIAD